MEYCLNYFQFCFAWHSKNSVGTHVCPVSEEDRSSNLRAGIYGLWPKLVWRRTPPSPKPADTDASEHWDVHPQQCPACCIQLCKLPSPGKSLGRSSGHAWVCSRTVLCFGNKNQCDGSAAALAELEVDSRSGYSALARPRQDEAISIGSCLLQILPQAIKTIQIAVNNPMQHCFQIPRNLNTKKKGKYIALSKTWEKNKLKQAKKTWYPHMSPKCHLVTSTGKKAAVSAPKHQLNAIKTQG